VKFNNPENKRAFPTQGILFEIKFQTKFFMYFAGFFLLMFVSLLSFSQEKKRVDIEQADFLESNEKIASNAQRLVGNVRIRHENILMWCDSAYTYTGTNRVDAFGNVHINQADTVDLYARKVYYNGDNSEARAYHNVRLINKSTTLFTDTLYYDMDANIGYYDNHGKIVDSTNTLTSVIGKYFVDTDIAHFYREVEGFSDKYTLTSDTLQYNTKTGLIFIEGPTTIRDSLNTLYAEKGWYDTNTGEAELLKKPVVYNETQQLTANYIKYNETDGNGRALGNVKIEDFENKIIVTGKTSDYNEKLEIATVTDSALFIMYSEKDTLFLHADTLKTIPDIVEDEKIIMAYYGTRFFRSDIQGICDSLIYFTKDSLVQLFKNPVIWSDAHQLTADHIEMQQHTNSPDELHLKNNSFIISKLDSGRFDQIKGKEMTGLVVQNKLDRIDVNGSGQMLYYAREEEDIIGLNRTESSKISIQFREGKVFRTAFLQSPEGVLKPLFELTEEEKTLAGFEWKIHLRPLSKHDVFEKAEEIPVPPKESQTEKEAEIIPAEKIE
jgi:lipopolysaccharide export system protein LptA